MTEPTKALQKWADQAMYEAIPTNDGSGDITVEPTVKLISMTSDPLGVIAAASRMYSGLPVGSLDDIADNERTEYFDNIVKTRLQAPFEFVNFHFLIEGVTRAFTHQLVRQRTAVYVQESQRFAVKSNGRFEVALPPSLAGTKSHSEVKKDLGNPEFISEDEWARLPKEQRMRLHWDGAVERITDTYMLLINSGMPAEDARGLLPTNITTRIHYKTDLRNLLGHAGNRLCTQAQFEWRKVFMGIAVAIKNGYMQDTRYQVTFANHGDTARTYLEEIKAEYAKLATLFRPICYATGKCEFMADLDRFCAIRDRVQANHAINRTSDQWLEPVVVKGEVIPAIRTEEWLLDPTSARRA